MPSSSPALFELWINPFSGRDLDVVSFTGREALSRPFSFDIRVLTPPDADLLDTSPLGQPATLLIQVPDHPARVVQGIIAAVQPEGTSVRDGRRPCRLRLVPRLWLLKHRTTSRIFQNLSVPDIIAKVLESAGIPRAFSLSRRYPARAYCVQYQESDEAFIHRLLAEEGIFYFFRHPAASPEALAHGAMPAETMVFGDSPQAYPPMASHPSDPAVGSSPVLSLREGQGLVVQDDDITAFTLRQKVRPGAALLRDYDFRRPLLEMRSEASTGEQDQALSSLRVYRHRGEYDEPEVNPVRAEVELARERRKAIEGKGESRCRRLAPGHHFQLEAEGSPHLAGAYAVTRVEHEGHTPELSGQMAESGGHGRTYTNRFACVPRKVAFRPRRPRRVLQQVLESATVVGPQGEEIHTDEHGRIKVQFHWDLDGKHDEHSSCWLRVIQTWAGASWGFQFIPRVGMEVMVTFLGGDQDCPVVVGCAHNATHPAPFMLPAHKTRSGVRTQSTPKSEGFNELSFEDSAGHEQVYLHAQRDLDEVVERNQTVDIRGDQRHSVAGSRSESVGRDASLSVRGDHGVQVSGASHLSVRQSRSASIEGDDSLTVKGSASALIAMNHSLAIEGNQSVMVGNGVSAAQSDTYVFGSASIGASERLVLRSEGGMVFECGDSAIEITPEGITLRAKSIDVQAAEAVMISGKGPALSLEKDVELVAKAIRFYAESSSIELDKEASIKGDKVLLNCDAGELEGKEGEGRARETQPFECKLSNYYLKPYASKKYHLMVEGLRFEGTTDTEGVVRQKIPKGAKQVAIKLWIDEYPTGRQRLYTLAVAEVPPANTARGAQIRLKHLGYYFGEPAEEENPQAKGALAAFQKDHAESHGLASTGELDATTAGALEDVYGS